jgi:hypothetical protein
MPHDELPEHGLTPFHGTKDSSPRRRRAGARLLLERLEDRTLPSGGLPYPTAATVSQLVADINAANQAGGTNAFNLAANTTFDLTAVDNTTNGANGLPVISGGTKKVAADNLTIVGNGATIQRDTASTTPAFRLFDVAQVASLTLENVTLQYGRAFGSGASADGGAIYNQGTLTLSGATVQDNIAQGSNGAPATGGGKNKNNQPSPAQPGADAAGGGIWSGGTLTLQSGTTISANQAVGGRGGSDYFYSSQTVNGGAGGAARGGGVYQASGNVTVSDATLVGNEAVGGVGGSEYGFNGISGNGGAGSGGGLYLAGGTLVVKDNSTVKSNQATGGNGGSFSGGSRVFGGTGGDGSGGGIYVGGGSVTLQSATLSSNRAQGGDGGEYHFTWGVTTGALLASRGWGGNGAGGGLYVGGGSVTLTGDAVTGNAADAGGSGFAGVPTGSPGVGVGGGLDILSAASVSLNVASLDAIVNNTASTSNPNIAGSYSTF